ncbi:hypothetical protein XELAEV_18028231mg [Xenopus laevis]|uniref:Uncharacterized protein n=1 Tax=Xenopus laevis TaxID=8355 RepID=A0A974CZ23_XENLA|nr:hypothetical protein XELAEV_18028231mg [Xenopus laevis]
MPVPVSCSVLYSVYISPHLAVHVALPCPTSSTILSSPAICSSLLLLQSSSALYPHLLLIYACIILSHPVCSCSTPVPIQSVPVLTASSCLRTHLPHQPPQCPLPNP